MPSGRVPAHVSADAELPLLQTVFQDMQTLPAEDLDLPTIPAQVPTEKVLPPLLPPLPAA